jgi:hypothetical protein
LKIKKLFNFSIYENQIENYKGQDPIELWSKYIEFCEQQDLNDLVTCELNLHALYKRCLQIFQNRKQYLNDERFINIFINYVIFSFYFTLSQSLVNH